MAAKPSNIPFLCSRMLVERASPSRYRRVPQIDNIVKGVPGCGVIGNLQTSFSRREEPFGELIRPACKRTIKRAVWSLVLGVVSSV
jgi:hypothetical protein